MSGHHTEIVLYTQHGCADSRRVRKWLTDRGVEFVERNVTDDLNVAKELLETGIFATPLLLIGDAKVLGYRPQKLAAALVGTDVPSPRPR